jgi:hypothetical protein
MDAEVEIKYYSECKIQEIIWDFENLKIWKLKNLGIGKFRN